MTVRIIQSIIGNTRNLEIKYNEDNPPIVFFDTNVWRSINDTDIAKLQCLQLKYGFRYRYSVTNFLELASHLEDQPSKSCEKPFQMFQSCFRRIHKLCDPDILPSPEMVFLAHAGLSHYIDASWIPDEQQMALAVAATGDKLGGKCRFPRIRGSGEMTKNAGRLAGGVALAVAIRIQLPSSGFWIKVASATIGVVFVISTL